jgi:hypothetical protein
LLHQATVLKKYEVSYYECPKCLLVQPEKPYWLKEAYENSMNLTDTGILVRNLYMREVASAIIGNFFNKSGSFVDFAGGYGVFTRLMRDYGFDYYWQDYFTTNVLARGFAYDKSITQPIELVSTFESFEHFENVHEDIAKISAISRNILFTTGIAKIPAPKPADWWYYGLEHGQHVSLYRRETLAYLAKDLGLNFYSHRNVHLFTEKKISPQLFMLIVRYPKMFSPFARRGMKSRHSSDMSQLTSTTK